MKVQRCVERCSGPAQRAQQYVQSELEQFQNSLGRCVQMCQDDIKDKVDSEYSEYIKNNQTRSLARLG